MTSDEVCLLRNTDGISRKKYFYVSDSPETTTKYNYSLSSPIVLGRKTAGITTRCGYRDLRRTNGSNRDRKPVRMGV